jgi:LacI family transcriptional regulator
MEENRLNDTTELLSVEIFEDDDERNIKLLQKIFDECQGIQAAITFNSKVHRLAKYFKILSHPEIKLIGYDVLEENITYLKEDIVSYLIAQRPEKQAYCSIRDMSYHLIFNRKINRINYVPIDILIKENIDYYLNFNE